MDKSKNGVDKVEKVADRSKDVVDRTEGWIEVTVWRVGQRDG
ncbi:hypothetical protein OL548_32480 [Lysinibacillus sp. MHQ-1]|nr:hypothetical protein OL548_32480 [Lysinibacillus sp. MHQ-1]